jgi:hypothetical protein
MITGGIVGLTDTDAFSNIDATRSSSVNVADENDALIDLSGFDASTVSTAPYKIRIVNQAASTLTSITADSVNANFEFRGGNGSGSVSISENIKPGGSTSFVVLTASGKTGTVADTIRLSITDTGGSFSFSADRTLTIDAVDPAVIANPSGKNRTAEHTWTVPNYTTVDGQVNKIELNYPPPGPSFDNVSSSDVTVTLTRQLSSGPDRSAIDVTQSGSSFSGENASIDLNGSFETSVVNDPSGEPNVEVIVNKVKNPSNGTYQSDISFDLSAGATDGFSADLDIVSAPFFNVDITNAPSEIFEGDTFDIDYDVTNTGTKKGKQDIKLTVDGSPERTNSNVQLNSSTTLSDSFNLNESKLTQSSPLNIAVESEDSTDSRTIPVVVPNEFSLTASPSTANANSTHTWEASETDFKGEVDTITVDYPSGFDFSGLDQTNITVKMERQLSTGPDTSEIDVNQDTYTGSKATFDLSGLFNTDLIGFIEVKIDGIENASAGSYKPTITLDGAKDNVSDTIDTIGIQ